MVCRGYLLLRNEGAWYLTVCRVCHTLYISPIQKTVFSSHCIGEAEMGAHGCTNPHFVQQRQVMRELVFSPVWLSRLLKLTAQYLQRAVFWPYDVVALVGLLRAVGMGGLKREVHSDRAIGLLAGIGNRDGVLLCVREPGCILII